MLRGYACIALDNPKSPENIGGVFRAAHCYGVALVVLGGPRPERLSKLPMDTGRAWKHIPHLLVADVFDALPHECTAIAVDLVEGARPLPGYVHPERAFYVFGGEDRTLKGETLARCRDRVMIPTSHCMNLASCVNVVLYDRMVKQKWQRWMISKPVPPACTVRTGTARTSKNGLDRK
jgi:tRNA(Leu) C34 or U34 (ribose-2'-O)-methylase TrmL